MESTAHDMPSAKFSISDRTIGLTQKAIFRFRDFLASNRFDKMASDLVDLADRNWMLVAKQLLEDNRSLADLRAASALSDSELSNGLKILVDAGLVKTIQATEFTFYGFTDENARDAVAKLT